MEAFKVNVAVIERLSPGLFHFWTEQFFFLVLSRPPHELVDSQLLLTQMYEISGPVQSQLQRGRVTWSKTPTR